MAAKVVFRIAKLKSWGQIGAAGDHNLRTRPTPNAVGEIKVIKGPADCDLVAEVRRTIGVQTVRKNAVLAVEILVSASPEFFRPGAPEKFGTWEPEKLASWRGKVEPWILENFPNAAALVLHLDEATPHYQIIDVPLAENGKLNCRGKYGGKATLVRWQDEAVKPVASLGIERGIEGSLAQHERIKNFYAAANAPVPVLPKVRTPKPEPLPATGLADRVPFSDAKARRDKREADHNEALIRREREIRDRDRAAAGMHDQIAAKANAADLAQRQKKAAEATAAKAIAALAVVRLQADRIRELGLNEVLTRMYGATEAADSKPAYALRKFDLPDGRKIALNGEKWIEDTAGKEGKGAINLVRHLEAIEFRPAVRLMAETFDRSILAAEHSRQQVARAELEVAEISRDESVPSPMPSPDRWPQVREWLEKVRGIPIKLVNWIHDKGLVYSDARGNAVFKRQNGGAIVSGAGDLKFNRVVGGQNCGAFIVPPAEGKINAIYLVEGPLDAIAIAACKPSAGAVACGGNLLPPVRLKGQLPEGVPVYAAFGKDAAGERLAAEVLKELGAAREAPPRGAKDWVEAIKTNPGLISATWVMAGGQGASASPQSEPNRPRLRAVP